MLSYFIIGVYLVLAGMGFASPAMAFGVYIWVDIFMPQLFEPLLSGQPISLIIVVICLVSWVMHPQRRGTLPWTSWLQLAIAGWMTLTMFWAAAPALAWQKWDWAAKSVFFTALLPAFVVSRRDVNLIVWMIVLSGMIQCAPIGIKTMFSGGGYGIHLGIIRSDVGWGEGSATAVFGSMLIPLCMWLIRHDQILPKHRLKTVVLGSFIVLIVAAVIGTFARAGIVSLLAITLCLVILGGRFRTGLVITACVVAGVMLAGDAWQARMLSSTDGSEASAAGRVSVWLWTLDYVSTHPFGGGFNVYVLNEVSRELENGQILMVKAKAFHSIYFEMLGEGGWPALFMFVTLLLASLVRGLRVRVASTSPQDAWRRELGGALVSSIVGMMTGAAFIGVAFQSLHYLLIGLIGVLVRLAKPVRVAGNHALPLRA